MPMPGMYGYPGGEMPEMEDIFPQFGGGQFGGFPGGEMPEMEDLMPPQNYRGGFPGGEMPEMEDLMPPQSYRGGFSGGRMPEWSQNFRGNYPMMPEGGFPQRSGERSQGGRAPQQMSEEAEEAAEDAAEAAEEMAGSEGGKGAGPPQMEDFRSAYAMFHQGHGAPAPRSGDGAQPVQHHPTEEEEEAAEDAAEAAEESGGQQQFAGNFGGFHGGRPQGGFHGTFPGMMPPRSGEALMLTSTSLVSQSVHE